MSNRGDEHYTKQAKKEGYLARSVYKLQEIDQKYHILDGAETILDIGCAPGSWLQYVSKAKSGNLKTKMDSNSRDDQGMKIIGFDLKEVSIQLPGVISYVQDIADRAGVQEILDTQKIETLDLILSDMAPDTIGMSDIDAIRSIGLIEKTLWIYDQYLAEGGKFAIKVFMGPGFDELVRELKNTYGASNIVTFKPKSCRKKSKETYIIKRS